MTRIGITMGDPKGIGPEIVAKMWKELSQSDRESLRIYGDRAVIEAASNIAQITFDSKHLAITSSITTPVGSVSDPDAARITLLALDAAIADIKNQNIKALVTAPVNKQRVQLIDPSFMGHTEKLAFEGGVKDIVMMFACPAHLPQHEALRISLATSHMALRDVPHKLSKQRILTTIRMTADALQRYFGCTLPRIAVLGLNPHAGEGGSMGSEEAELIIPAIATARKEGITTIGPLPVESLFGKFRSVDFDGIVAMYHDQGLTPMKIACPKKSTNITLGLPFIRTSPGHGTAEDIAWRGTASPDSMIAALEMTKKLLKHS